MTNTDSNPDSGATVSGSEALKKLNDATIETKKVYEQAKKEAREIAGDTSMHPDLREEKVRRLNALRDEASSTMSRLDKQKRAIVEDGIYGQAAVDALSAATQKLRDSVLGTTRLAERVDKVTELLGAVADAGNAVVKSKQQDS